MPNKLQYFAVYELICKLFGNNNLIWKLQFRYVALLVKVSVSLVLHVIIVFTISIAFINIVFLLDEIFIFFVKGGRYHQRLCFVLKKIRKYIQNSFIQNKQLFIGIGIYKSSVEIKHINCSSDKISVCILVVPDFAKKKVTKK